ncbi:MAG: MoaD/ThiS family protein [Deltaproteobacteria bacterium]|jgi:molybdopterin converting factor small subunit
MKNDKCEMFLMHGGLNNNLEINNNNIRTMYVSVTFLGLQRAQAQTDRIQVSLLRETSVADLLSYIKECYPNLRTLDDGILVAVNSKVSSLERVLKNKDDVIFLPFLGGG